MSNLFKDATLVLKPSGRNVSELYLLKPETTPLTSLNFSRTSTAYERNSSGDLEQVTGNKPRISFEDGVGSCPSLLLEPARTNLITYSEQFDNAAWGASNITVTANAGTAPDGTSTADNITLDAVNDLHIIAEVVSVTSGTQYTQTYFVKDNGLSLIQLYSAGGGFGGFVTSNYANFDLSNGTVYNNGFTSATITELANGWFRISATRAATANSSGVIGLSGIESVSDGYRPSFVGDGTSGLLVWGAQLEEGGYPTSYIKTEAATVTRSAEALSKTGIADLLGDAEGTLYFEGIFSPSSSSCRITLSDGTSNNRVSIYSNAPATQVDFLVSVGGSPQAAGNSGISFGTINKYAIKYAPNDFAFWVNGVEVVTDLNGSTFSDGTLTDLQFNFGAGSGNEFYGNVKALAVWDTALTDAELTNLTTT